MVKWDESLARQYDKILVEKETMMKPAVLKALGDVKGKKIADLGCGSGWFSRILAKKGAYVKGVDRSEVQLNMAMQKDMTNISYMRNDIENTKLKSGYFDVALITLVFVEISSPKKISRILAEANRILMKGGMLVIGDVHPHCIGGRSKIDSLYLEKGKNYFDNGAKMKGICLIKDGTKIVFYPDYHYTLEFLINETTKKGFVITKLLEPEYKENFPANILIAARKM